jgi:hypothetical protein
MPATDHFLTGQLNMNGPIKTAAAERSLRRSVYRVFRAEIDLGVVGMRNADVTREALPLSLAVSQDGLLAQRQAFHRGGAGLRDRVINGG